MRSLLPGDSGQGDACCIKGTLVRRNQNPHDSASWFSAVQPVKVPALLTFCHEVAMEGIEMGIEQRIEQYGPVFEAVRQDVLEFAEQTGREKLVFCLKGDDGRLDKIFESEGGKQAVSVTEVQGLMLHVLGRHGVIVHSHPPHNPTSLSPEDINNCLSLGCETWAVTGDGGMYWCGGVGKQVRHLEAAHKASTWTSSFSGLVLEEARCAYEAKALGEHELDMASSHLVCEALARKGFLLYEAVLGSKMRESLRKWGEWRADRRVQRTFMRRQARAVLAGVAV